VKQRTRRARRDPPVEVRRARPTLRAGSSSCAGPGDRGTCSAHANHAATPDARRAGRVPRSGRPASAFPDQCVPAFGPPVKDGADRRRAPTARLMPQRTARGRTAIAERRQRPLRRAGGALPRPPSLPPRRRPARAMPAPSGARLPTQRALSAEPTTACVAGLELACEEGSAPRASVQPAPGGDPAPPNVLARIAGATAQGRGRDETEPEARGGERSSRAPPARRPAMRSRSPLAVSEDSPSSAPARRTSGFPAARCHQLSAPSRAPSSS